MILDWLNHLIDIHATSHDITLVAMCVRAVIVFFVALGLIQLTGTRAFGSGSAFDMVLRIILGAVLSRAVVAASPFWGTLVAGVILVLLHRLLAIAAYHNDFVGKLIKGEPTILAQHGQVLTDNLRKAEVSEKDLHEGIRDAANLDSLAEAETVRLERSGKISVVKEEHPQESARP